MSNAHFRFSVAILKRLGEELNPNFDHGVIELVKNSYDANARSCTVELEETSEPGGTVRITDNGDGLTLKQIRDGWFVLGASDKDPEKTTRLGRKTVGSKGLGRLAALRMGRLARLTTRARSHPGVERIVEIDWDLFDEAKLVEDVSIEIKTRKTSKKSPGTTIELEGVRSKIGRVGVRRLARAMLLLADPFGEADQTSFKPRLKSPEYTDLAKLVDQNYFQEAEFHLCARVDEEGIASAEVVDWKGNPIYEAAHEDLKGESSEEPYGCPPAQLDLWVYILSRKKFDLRLATIDEVKRWLTEFGGVHVYHNGIRVEPYGNPGNDWLDMNLLRAKNPELRPSTSTSIGRLQVEGSDALLTQKTDRAGFIETEGFAALRTLGQDALEWMARRRVRDRDKRRVAERSVAPSKTDKAREQAQKAIGRLPRQSRKIAEAAIQRLDTAHRTEVRTLRKEVQLYRTLSTAGITASTFAHESTGSPLKIIEQSLATVVRRGRKLSLEFDEKTDSAVGRISKALNTLSVLSGVTLSLVRADKRRLMSVSVNKAIKNVFDVFAPLLSQVRIEPDLQLIKGAPKTYGSDAALESVVANLLTNSITALRDRPEGQRTVQVRTDCNEDIVILAFEDNGPGIRDIDLKDIWTPGQTTKSEGTGLGLTIVRDTIADLGGKVIADQKGELGGAVFTIELPLIQP